MYDPGSLIVSNGNVFIKTSTLVRDISILKATYPVRSRKKTINEDTSVKQSVRREKNILRSLVYFSRRNIYGELGFRVGKM